jgi:hypothetical protein
MRRLRKSANPQTAIPIEKLQDVVSIGLLSISGIMAQRDRNLGIDRETMRHKIRLSFLAIYAKNA